MTAAPATDLTLRRFLDESRRKVRVVLLAGHACRAVFWIAIMSAPVVAFRAVLGISDSLLATALVITSVLFAGIFAARMRLLLRQVLGHMELPTVDRDQIDSASEFMTESDPFKRLALRKTEDWLRDHSTEIVPKKRWPREAMYAGPALLALLILWWLTPSWIRPPSAQAIVTKPTTAPSSSPSNSGSDHDGTANTTAANQSSGANGDQGTSGGVPKSSAGNESSAGRAASGAGSPQKSSSASSSHGSSNSSAQGQSSSDANVTGKNSLPAGSQTGNGSGEGRPNPDATNGGTHTSPSGQPASRTGAGGAENATSGARNASPKPQSVAPQAGQRDEVKPGGSGGGGPDAKLPSNQSVKLPVKDVAAPKSSSATADKEREVAGEMDDPNAAPQAVGAPKVATSQTIKEPDAAEMEDLPARRRAVVIEYFRAMRATSGATTRPTDSGDTSK